MGGEARLVSLSKPETLCVAWVSPVSKPQWQPCVPSHRRDYGAATGVNSLALGEITETCTGRQAWPVKGKRGPLAQIGMATGELACSPHCLWGLVRTSAPGPSSSGFSVAPHES